MRIFIALDISDDIRCRITRFVEEVRESAQDARWVIPESLHVTLKFVGEKSPDEVENILRNLQKVESERIEIQVRGYGFFPDGKSPRAFWIGVQAASNLGKLAERIDEAMGSLGIAKERRAFTPHLTLARAAGRSASRHRGKDDGLRNSLQRLQQKLLAMPPLEFGRMTACEFSLYQSQLTQGGSHYTKLANFGLRQQFSD